MDLPKSFTTVTTLSKTLAAILFIAFPFLGFYLGMQYQKGVSPQFSNQITPSPSTQPDVNPTPTTYEGMFCGGIAGITCATGFICQITNRNPDASGKCVLSSDEIPPKSWDESVCTQEAKLCPDGSYVGRQGPNCEFAPCPN